MKVLVMPFVSTGNMFDFEWSSDNWNVLLSCIKQCIYTMLLAFDKHLFIHNDTHTKNIMIVKTSVKSIKYHFSFNKTIEVPCFGYKTVFMDFENSLTGNKIEFVYNDIGRLCSDIKYNMNLDIKNLLEFVSFVDMNKSLPLDKILHFIERQLEDLSWSRKLTFDVPVYDPNKF